MNYMPAARRLRGFANRCALITAIAAGIADAAIAAQPPATAATQSSGPAAVAVPSAQQEAGFRIDQPGTITFTVGVKIVGKVEKPEVVIFLPKEKPYFRPILFSHSFKEDILEPLPLEPEAGP